MSESALLITTLKQCLREHGVTYADIAIPLNLSEASVKRLFADKSFSLKRLEIVCRHINMTLNDLMQRLEQSQAYISQLTEAQEKKLVEDNRLVLVTLLVFSDWTFDHLLKICNFKEPELIQLLIRLQKIGLIELLPLNRIKLLTANNFSWRKNGPAFNYFKNYIQRDYFQSNFTEDNEKLFVLTGMLSEDRRLEFAKRLEHLVREFDLICKADKKTSLDDRLGYSVILAMRRWTLDVFQEYVK